MRPSSKWLAFTGKLNLTFEFLEGDVSKTMFDTYFPSQGQKYLLSILGTENIFSIPGMEMEVKLDKMPNFTNGNFGKTNPSWNLIVQIY